MTSTHFGLLGKYLLFFSSLVLPAMLAAQGVAINTDNSTADPSAALEVKSTSGGILVPRMSTTDRINIASPATGLLVYDTDLSAFYFYSGTAWTAISSGGETDPQVASTTISYVPRWDGTVLTDGSVFDDGANVGIGTTTPSTKLHIAGGDLRIDRGTDMGSLTRTFTISGARSGLNSSFAQINFENYDPNDGMIDYVGAQIYSWNSQTYDDGDLRFSTYDGTLTTRMTISNTGNVGIGTISPTELLDISGKTKTTTLQLTTGATNGYVLQSDASGNGTWANANGLGALRYVGNSYLAQNAGQGSTGTSEGTSSNLSLTAIGKDALQANTDGYRNNAIGTECLKSNTTGRYNNAFGYAVLSRNTTGESNNALGDEALSHNTTGGYNTGIGDWALYQNTTGDYNIGIGVNSL